MSRLELAWSAWSKLSGGDRALFLCLLREAYSRKRAAVVLANGGGSHGARVASLTDLTLTEADFRAALVE